MYMYVDQLVYSVMETTWVLHNRGTATFLDVRLHKVKVTVWSDRQTAASVLLIGSPLCPGWQLGHKEFLECERWWEMCTNTLIHRGTHIHTQRNGHTFCGLFDLLAQPTATVKTKGGPPAEGRGIVAWEWVKIYQSLLDVFCVSSNNRLPERLRLGWGCPRNQSFQTNEEVLYKILQSEVKKQTNTQNK